MEIKQITCDYCNGRGYNLIYEVVSENKENGTCTAQRKDVICEKCDGKGWIDYPVFSVEEAKAILKHCGLSTES